MKAQVKKIFIGIIGGLIVAAGIVMLVLPGPAFIVIPAGLAILATEFHWARRLKEGFKHKFEEFRTKHRLKKEARRRSSFAAR